MAPIESPATENERIARLEEQVAALRALLTEMHAEQREMVETFTRVSGGFRMVLALGALGAAWGVLRTVGAWISAGTHP